MKRRERAEANRGRRLATQTAIALHCRSDVSWDVSRMEIGDADEITGSKIGSNG